MNDQSIGLIPFFYILTCMWWLLVISCSCWLSKQFHSKDWMAPTTTLWTIRHVFLSLYLGIDFFYTFHCMMPSHHWYLLKCLTNMDVTKFFLYPIPMDPNNKLFLQMDSPLFMASTMKIMPLQRLQKNHCGCFICWRKWAFHFWNQ
jgi:hypothetical protein